MRARSPRSAVLGILLAGFLAGTGPAAWARPWRILKPSNTGIPGELVDLVRVAPDGRIWVAARWPFWHESGLGILDTETDLWTTHANWETPLPSEFVNDLVFEPGGAAWMATDHGLVKKQGDSWTVYTTANAPLLHNTIRNLSLAPNGHLWINNSNVQNNLAAIFEFDGTTWRKFQVGVNLPWSPPWSALSDVMVDRRGHVWVANQVLNGVAEYDGLRWTLHGADVDRFDAIQEDTRGNLWLRAGVGGWDAFYKLDALGFTTYPEPTTPTAIGIGADGAVYLANWNGRVRRTRDGGQTWVDYLTGLDIVLQVAPHPGSGEVWIGTRTAVGRFAADGTWLRDYNTYNTGMPWYFVDGMAKDRQGNFWLATGEAGLSRFDGLRWRNWGEHNAGAEPYPFEGNEPMGACYQDRGGVHWMGGNGIGRWQSATGTFTGFWNWQNNPGMAPTLFTHFAEDGEGRLLAASEDGDVFHFDGVQWVREAVSPYLLAQLPGMKADGRGNVWLASTFALHVWDGRSWGMLGDEWLFFDWGGATALSVGPDDTLWIGTQSGLARWDGVSLDLFDTSNSPMPADHVTGIDVREDGTVAVAAADFGPVTPFPAGVAVIRGDPELPASWSVSRYGASPLPHYQLGRVAFDAQGSLWISAVSEGVAVQPGCSPAGWINLVRDSAVCGATVQIGLTDCDLDLDPSVPDAVVVRVTSAAEPAGEAVLLTEIAAAAGVFSGSIPVSAFDLPGVVRVGTSDVLQVSYLDASDGGGGSDLLRTDTASASCATSPMVQTLLALDRDTFGWDTPQDVDWVRGTLSQLRTYGYVDFLSASQASSIAAPEVPAPGSGFYWIVRPDGPTGSWSVGDAGECAAPGACPSGGRDGNLPIP